MAYVGLFLVAFGSICYRWALKSGYDQAVAEAELIADELYMDMFRAHRDMGFMVGREEARDIRLQMTTNLRN